VSGGVRDEESRGQPRVAFVSRKKSSREKNESHCDIGLTVITSLLFDSFGFFLGFFSSYHTDSTGTF
jgi:hypothetical protein